MTAAARKSIVPTEEAAARSICYIVCLCVRVRAHVYIQSDVYLFNNSNYDSIRLYCSPRARVDVARRYLTDTSTKPPPPPPRRLRRLADPPEATLPPFDRGPVTPTFPAPVSVWHRRRRPSSRMI